MPWKKGVGVFFCTAIAVKWFSWDDAPKSVVKINEDNFVSAASCMDRSKRWAVEFSNFSSRSASERQYSPSLQIQRLKERCLLSGREVPVMRIVGFFPHIHPSTLYELVTDRERRLHWDSHYLMFDNFIGSQEPPDRVLSSPKCEDYRADCCPHVITTMNNNGWFTHRVGSFFLDSLGIATRQFLYFRRSYQFRLLSKDLRQHFSLFHIIYDGCDQTIEKALEDGELTSWVEKNQKSTTVVHSKMNYQHIALLPVADMDAQLYGENAESFRLLSNSGSIFDRDMFCNALAFSSDSLSLAEKQKENQLSGTLCIITSANDVHIPFSIPKMVQRKMASSMTVKVYNTLMKAALQYQSE